MDFIVSVYETPTCTVMSFGKHGVYRHGSGTAVPVLGLFRGGRGAGGSQWGNDLPVEETAPSPWCLCFKIKRPVTVGHTWVEGPPCIAFDQFDRVSLQAEK